jgi:hypothetical protein
MAKLRRKPKSAVRVRRSTHRSGAKTFWYGLFRFALYGIFGIAMEIVFYNLVRNLSGVPVVGLLFQFDWQVDESLGLSHMKCVAPRSLFGQCSLWMFPVYAVASFCIEFLYRNFTDVFWPLRALAYGLVIFLWECASGWLLFWTTGLKIWFYADAGNFFEMTSWRILPIWCLTGLFVEYLYRQLMDPDLVKAIETATLEPTPPSP